MPRMGARFCWLTSAVLLVACGGGRAGVAPTPTRTSVTFVVFLDENGNGTAEPAETIRFPGVDLSVAGASARTGTTGEVTIEVPTGPVLVSVADDTLPPWYRSAAGGVALTPAGGRAFVPVTLPLGPGATPGVYLAFGDSITNGQVATGDGQGYTGQLERALAAHFGRARVINDGLDSSNSERGDGRIAASLSGGHPAFTLILYGTNDWSDPRCGGAPCFTVESLRSMVRKVKAQGGFPFVGTLLMTNVGNDFRASPQRNAWVLSQNADITRMAGEEGATLVDLHAAFELSPYTYSELFADYIHPSAIGYRVMAEAWFGALTKRR